VTRGLAVEPRAHQRSRVPEHLLHVDVLGARPRRDARVPARLVHPHVAYSGNTSLVLERRAEQSVQLDAGDVVREDVRPQPPSRGAAELEHRAVEEQRLVRGAAEHQPGAAEHLLAARLHPPASLHPQVAAHDDVPLEGEEEVLADRVDRLENAAVDPLGDVLHRGARVRRLGLDPLADEHLEPLRGACECVPLWHSSKHALRVESDRRSTRSSNRRGGQE
jgi:hypothetical protein